MLNSAMTIKEIANEIKKKTIARKPIIIAVEGFGGAGKSTFATNLKRALGDASVIEIDDFFLKDVKSDATKSNFDRKRLTKQVLAPARSGQPIVYQKLEWDTNTLSKPLKVLAVSYLIIEGVSSFHPDIANYMDYKIWVEASKEVARQRMIERDKALGDDHGELWDHWTETYQAYKDLYQPETAADFVFDDHALD